MGAPSSCDHVACSGHLRNRALSEVTWQGRSQHVALCCLVSWPLSLGHRHLPEVDPVVQGLGPRATFLGHVHGVKGGRHWVALGHLQRAPYVLGQESHFLPQLDLWSRSRLFCGINVYSPAHPPPSRPGPGQARQGADSQRQRCCVPCVGGAPCAPRWAGGPACTQKGFVARARLAREGGVTPEPGGGHSRPLKPSTGSGAQEVLGHPWVSRDGHQDQAAQGFGPRGGGPGPRNARPAGVWALPPHPVQGHRGRLPGLQSDISVSRPSSQGLNWTIQWSFLKGVREVAGQVWGLSLPRGTSSTVFSLGNGEEKAEWPLERCPAPCWSDGLWGCWTTVLT